MWLADAVSEHSRRRNEALACLEDAVKRRPAGTSTRTNETRTRGHGPKTPDEARRKERGRTGEVAPAAKAEEDASAANDQRNAWGGADDTGLETNGKLGRPWNDEVWRE